MKESRAKILRLFDYLRDNRWTLVTLVIASFIIFMIGRNLIHALEIRTEIVHLEKDAKRYQERITQDSTLLEHLTSDKELERFARENYHMQRSNEEIFIIK